MYDNETDGIMTQIPQKCIRNDKKSFLSMNAYLREGEKSSFHCQTVRCSILNQIQYNAKNFIEFCSNIQKQS